MGIERVRPQLVATNLITGEKRTDRVVLQANADHNSARKARLGKVVFINDMTPAQALDAVCDREGVIDIVTEISPADAARVETSEHAKLVTIEANRVLLGIFNTWPETGAPLSERPALVELMEKKARRTRPAPRKLLVSSIAIASTRQRHCSYALPRRCTPRTVTSSSRRTRPRSSSPRPK